jgi:hypothetical protein
MVGTHIFCPACAAAADRKAAGPTRTAPPTPAAVKTIRGFGLILLVVAFTCAAVSLIGAMRFNPPPLVAACWTVAFWATVGGVPLLLLASLLKALFDRLPPPPR